MTAMTAPARVAPSRPGFGATLASEWTKLRSVRSNWIIVGLALLLPIGFSALISLVTGVTFDEWGPNEQAAFDPVLNSMAGILFLVILLIVFGALAITSEYGSGLIRSTFSVTPRRARVLFAKAAVVGAVAIVVAVLAFLGMFLAGQAIFGAYGLETASITNSDFMRMLAYSPISALIYTMIPLSIGVLLRGTAGAITASIGFFIAPWILTPLLPTWFDRNVVRFLPDWALDSLTGVTATDAATYLSPGPAVVVIATWFVVALGAALFVLQRRDA